MSGQQFTFPPPPPPPPQATQSNAGYAPPLQGRRGSNGRDPRGGRSYRGAGRGSIRGDSRAGNFGSSHSTHGYGGHALENSRYTEPQNTGYIPQESCYTGGGYPPPNYPPAPRPHYPSNLRQEYSQPLPDYPSPQTRSDLPGHAFSTHQQEISPYHDRYPSYSSQSYSPATPYGQPTASAFQDARPPANSFSSQPVLVAPPIRMGFDGQQQSHQLQSLPQPNATGTISFQNTPLHESNPQYRRDFPSNQHYGHHQSQNESSGHRGPNRKRGHGEAFGKPRNQNSRPHAPPAVPRFGGALPLPVKPPVSQERSRKPRKKKRKHNQLGLTPKTVEHESSEEEEEDDVDEESKLAAAVTGSNTGSQMLQFEYKGQTSTLNSSSDISAWIEERRKRFPTKARAAEALERKKQQRDAQQAANQARKEAQERKKAEDKEKQRQKYEVEQKRKEPMEGSEDVAAKAQRKVEKLRKRLEKEERRAARAMAKAAKSENLDQGPQIIEKASSHSDRDKKRKRSESVNSSSRVSEGAKPKQETSGVLENTHASGAESLGVTQCQGKSSEPSNHDLASDAQDGRNQGSINAIPDPLTPMSQPSEPDESANPKTPLFDLQTSPDDKADTFKIDNKDAKAPHVNSDQAVSGPGASISSSSSDISSTDPEDFTSSSGSSSSGSESDDDAPDQASSKRTGPEKVPPPKRTKPKAICNFFLKNGRCKWGDRCQYKHELPERGSRDTRREEVQRPEKKTERVGLHQRLVEQEIEKENEAILKAIIHLGEKGVLDAEAPNGDTEHSKNS